jgi:hypothetical protein
MTDVSVTFAGDIAALRKDVAQVNAMITGGMAKGLGEVNRRASVSGREIKSTFRDIGQGIAIVSALIGGQTAQWVGLAAVAATSVGSIAKVLTALVGGPITIVLGAIALLGGAIAGAATHWDAFRSTVVKVWAVIVDKVGGAVAQIARFLQGVPLIGDIFGESLESIAQSADKASKNAAAASKAIHELEAAQAGFKEKTEQVRKALEGYESSLAKVNAKEQLFGRTSETLEERIRATTQAQIDSVAKIYDAEQAYSRLGIELSSYEGMARRGEQMTAEQSARFVELKERVLALRGEISALKAATEKGGPFDAEMLEKYRKELESLAKHFKVREEVKRAQDAFAAAEVKIAAYQARFESLTETERKNLRELQERVAALRAEVEALTLVPLGGPLDPAVLLKQRQELEAMLEKLSGGASMEVNVADVIPKGAEEQVAERLTSISEQFEVWKLELHATLQDLQVITMATFDGLAAGIGNAFAQVLAHGENVKEVLDNLWRSIVGSIISSLVTLGVQELIYLILVQLGAVKRAAAGVASYAATGAAAAGAAMAYAAASYASEGGIPGAVVAIGLLATIPAVAAAAGAGIVGAAAAAGKAGGVAGAAAVPAARGIAVSGPTYALIGEGRDPREYVLPHSTLERMTDSSGGGGGTMHVHVHVDGRELSDVMAKHLPDTLRAAGIRV